MRQGEKRDVDASQNVDNLIFQCLEPQHLLSALYWRLRGVHVYAQAFRHLPKSVIDLLGIKTLNVDSRPAVKKVRLELVESVFCLLLEKTLHVTWSRRLFDSEDIDQAFRRQILEELEEFFITIEGIARAGLPQSGSVVVSGCSNMAGGFAGLVQSDRLSPQAFGQIEESHQDVIRRIRVMGPSRLVGLIRLFLEVGYSCWFVFKRLRWTSRPRQKFQLAIRSYLTDWGFDLGGMQRIRNVDFLVDGKSFHAGNTIFWLEDTVCEDQYKMSKLKERGYPFAFPSRLTYDRSFARNIALPALKSYLGYRLYASLKDVFESRTCRGLWKSYLLAKVFSEYFRPRHLLVYNDVGFTSTARNLALRSMGCTSVFYPHSYNWAIDVTGYWRPHPWIAFLYYDVLASWGRLQADYYQSAGGHYGTLLNLGCLWSEHIRLVKENETIRSYYNHQLASLLSMPLENFRWRIAVFDTSISSMLSAHDLSKFYADIVRLSQQLKNVLFLCKPKNPIEELFFQAGESWEPISKKVQGASNIVLLPHHFETATAVGLTDLTISACFTNTTVEAIGCGNRAIYYDPTNRFSHAFWHRIPALVCVTPDDLYERARYLLWECDDESYLRYLRTHLLDIEGYFDGRAITRLRQRLCTESQNSDIF